MGLTEEVWAKIQQPKRGMFDDLAKTSQVYVDTYVALELLHCSYGEYIQRVPRLERLHNQFFVMLRTAKEEYAQEQAEQQAEVEREARDASHGRY